MVVPLIKVISSIFDHQKLFRFHIGFPVLPGNALLSAMPITAFPTTAYISAKHTADWVMAGADPPSLKKSRQTSKLWSEPYYQNIEPFGCKCAKNI